MSEKHSEKFIDKQHENNDDPKNGIPLHISENAKDLRSLFQQNIILLDQKFSLFNRHAETTLQNAE